MRETPMTVHTRPAPYYEDEYVTLYCGDMREVLPTLGQFDAAICDAPYGETSLAWDRWVDGWPTLIAAHTSRMWCFGTLGMFMDHAAEFSGWKRPRSIVWEKHNGSGFSTDFFKGVHELAGYLYRGAWADAHETVPRAPRVGPNKSVLTRSRSATPHTGAIGSAPYVDDGTRLMRSVIRAQSMHGRAIHPTEKPGVLLAPMLTYAVPPGGIVFDPFAGSCSTLLTARQLGFRAVGIEADEEMCERAVVERLSVPELFVGASP